jgi:acetylornithine deacetylase/succinyl-diaminopimelate desuccinylase-like protein
MFGFPLDDCNMHAPNEKIHIPTMLKGTQVLLEFFQTPTSA